MTVIYSGLGIEAQAERAGVATDLDPRTDLRKHSPTGFSYGYSGSGPAQLALAILTHHFASHPADVTLVPANDIDRFGADAKRKASKTSDAAALSLYQSFKAAFVARWPEGQPWSVTSEQITAWIEHVHPPLVAEAIKATILDETDT